MRLYSTRNKNHFASLQEAVFRGLPPDNGLYMPEKIPQLSPSFIKNLDNKSFVEIGYEVAKLLFDGAIPDEDTWRIVENALTFPAPIAKLTDSIHVLELFHGPSLAFKDFGARFMAQLMGYFNQDNHKELVILVATSGDTGGAVAAGFYKTPGTKVVILYPSGKVSHLQEKQLTTLGENISAVEVQGTFDDCQALVKSAFLDTELTSRIRLSSANSINIARLIPQSFYYFEAYKQLEKDKRPVVFSVPSGNFGNLTAGLFAKKMGLPIHKILAATNANDVVPQYLHTGIYAAKPSIPTLSNAMDVGDPSNFARMMDFFGSTWNNFKNQIEGYSYNDDKTRAGMQEVYSQLGYIIDPHGAIGYLALKEYLGNHSDQKGVILETAHPSKFLADVDSILGISVVIPKRLAELKDKTKYTTLIEADFTSFKDWLLSNY